VNSSRRQNQDVVEILYRKKREYEQRVEEKKVEKENNELLGCTFHPNILQSPGGHSNGESSGIKVYGSRAMGQGSLQNSRGSFGWVGNQNSS
jgi:hypothetical protein